MRYVIHHAGTGVILRHGQCHADEVALQEVPAGHAVLTLPDAHAPPNDLAHQVAGGVLVARTATAPDPVAAMQALRRRRDHRLAASDWTQLADAPLSPESRAAWAVYRQALRALPDNTPDPANPVWPAAPKKD